MRDEIDISLMPYDEWLSFVFDHPVRNNSPQDGWYSKRDYNLSVFVSNPAQLVEHVTRLCHDFTKLVDTYSLPQINLGLWFVIGPTVDLGQYLREKDVLIEVRKSCVRSMYRVYADFVSQSDAEEMETIFYMWWDMLLCAFYWMVDSEIDEDAREIENTILETLAKILQLDDIRTQQYALHGLGHLEHPKVRDVVAEYINAHGDEWTEDSQQWLQTCLDGTVL